MGIKNRQHHTGIVDLVDFDCDDSIYTSSAEHYLAEWATGSDENGNLVISGNVLAEHLRADCY